MNRFTNQVFGKGVALKGLAVLLSVILVTDFSCTSSPCRFENPDQTRFNQIVLSSALQESLRTNSLTVGMPYFVAQDIFRNCREEIGTQVASVGSKKQCLEREGLYSNYQDPGTEIYLDQYHTAQATLYVWYGDPDFYRSRVVAGDSIFLFRGNQIDTARILSLLKPNRLKVDKSLKKDPVQYAEIHHAEPNGKVTYWYHLAISDSNVKLDAQQKSEYPISGLELDNNPISSFHWR